MPPAEEMTNQVLMVPAAGVARLATELSLA